MKQLILLIGLFCALNFAAGQSGYIELGGESAENASTSKNAKNDINYVDAFILGLIEGVTEFLPVSSTGHLILANSFLSLEDETPLLDSNGSKIHRSSDEVFTMKMAASAYIVVIQLGAILAVALLYWDCIMQMIFGLLGRNPAGLRLLINLFTAFIPAALVGYFFHSEIETHLFGIKPVIIALAAGALLMLLVQKLYDKRNRSASNYHKMENMTIRQSLVVGVLQCVAMWPGTSRSMMTILGGYVAGLKPADAARFSFLLGLVTLSAAAIFKAYSDGDAICKTLSIGPLAVGLIVAFISAAISVKWMVGFLTRRGLAPFAWYRLILAAVLCALLYFNLL